MGLQRLWNSIWQCRFLDCGNDFAKKTVIFRVEEISSSLKHNLKNNTLVLDEGPTDDINGSCGYAEQKFTPNFG